MSVTVTPQITQQTVTVTGNPVENNVTVTVSNARGPAGADGGGAWGDITGTLADQTDLQAALDAKQPLSAVLSATTASFTTADETKLDGIATGATANSSDATLLARANHTGTQDVSTITGLGTLATQSGTFSGTSSGTNTGDQDLAPYAKVAYSSGVAVQAAAQTSSVQTLKSYTIPANTLGANGWIRLTGSYRLKLTGTTTVNIKLGTQVVKTITNISGQNLINSFSIMIHNRNSTSSQVISMVSSNGTTYWGSAANSDATGGTGGGGAIALAADTTANLDLALSVQLAVASDLLVADFFTVETFYQA